jgi:histone H3/H4
VGLFLGAVTLRLHRGTKTLNGKDVNYTRRIGGDVFARGRSGGDPFVDGI